jgi:hypothetical protein
VLLLRRAAEHDRPDPDLYLWWEWQVPGDDCARRVQRIGRARPWFDTVDAISWPDRVVAAASRSLTADTRPRHGGTYLHRVDVGTAVIPLPALIARRALLEAGSRSDSTPARAIGAASTVIRSARENGAISVRPIARSDATTGGALTVVRTGTTDVRSEIGRLRSRGAASDHQRDDEQDPHAAQ